MRAMLIEEPNILLADVIKMAEAETEEVVQAFALQLADPCFREGVRIRCKHRRSEAANVGALEEPPERSRELAVAVVDEKPRRELLIRKPHQQVSSLLLDPPIVRVIRGRTEKHPARADVDEREAVRDPHAQRRDDALGEKVAGDERVHVEPDELLPGGLTSLSSARRRGRESLILQNSPNGGSSELQPQLGASCGAEAAASRHVAALASELRRAGKAVYFHPECSENVNGFVREMHDMRNMQISVCLCGKTTYV